MLSFDGRAETLIFGIQFMSMPLYRNLLLLAISVVLLTGCKDKKKPSLAGDEPVEVSDFVDFFPVAELPFQFADSTLSKKDNDSLRISYKVFTQFVPDSVLGKVFGKDKKLKIYPLGKAEVAKAETYLFAKITGAGKKAAFIVALDNDNKFLAALPAVRTDLPKSSVRSAVIDRRYTITKTQLRKNADGSLSEGKDVYVLNADARNFMLIMTDALEDKVTELINPIDTLPRKHKLSADYATGKLNLVSIRDGRKADRLTFFIHFEKDNGECTGELKGEAMIRSANLAEYKVGGDPCVLQFRFTSSSVTLKEMEGCGAHRGLRCAFDGSFPRKKEIKPKSVKAKLGKRK